MNTAYDYLSGIGLDVHALMACDKADNSIVLCGIQVPCPYQIKAHSDGDVGLHALVDAMLGAISAGDIGEHFPPTDPKWSNADSSQFVTHALALCDEKKATLVNADITLICEQPKITPYKKNMQKKVSQLLNLPIARVNIKATTTETLGFLGRIEGIAAQAIVNVKIPAAE